MVAGQSATVERRDFNYHLTVRTEVFAQEEQTITNPIPQTNMVTYIPDGDYVSSGSLVTQLDTLFIGQQLDNLKHDRAITEAMVGKDLAVARNKELDLRDQLAELNDRRLYLEAMQQRLKSLPQEDDVRIAEGRQRVARLNQEAAGKDMEKARGRFDRQMISSAELDKFAKDLRDKQALLDYANEDLAFARRPAEPLKLQRVQLELTNARLEIDKLEKETRKNARLYELQKKNADARKQLIERYIKEQEEYLNSALIMAPISGYIMHTAVLKNSIMSSGQLWKNFSMMKIPNLKTLALKGMIPEAERQHFSVGDQVEVHLAPRPDVELPATIKSFSSLSHDMGEPDKASFKWGGSNQESGVKVYDVVVQVTAMPDWVRPGMHAACEIKSGQKSSGPSVPVGFVKQRDGLFFLAFDGKYQKVAGRIVGAYFVFNDSAFLGRQVDLYGTEGESATTAQQQKKGEKFSITGEMLPVKTTEVVVGRLHNFRAKVTWLIAEDTYVKAGDVVARLDTKEVDDDIKKQDSTIQAMLSARETLGEQRNLKLEDSKFKLAKQKNLLEMTRVDWQAVEQDRQWVAISAARLARDQAKNELDFTTRRLEWVKSKAIPVMSPFERRRLEREKQRCELNYEQARINLAVLEAGAKPVERSTARQGYNQGDFDFATLVKSGEQEDFQINMNLRKAKLDEQYSQMWMAEMELEKSHAVLRAPVGGLVQYAKILNAMVVEKVSVGSEVANRYVLMKLADVSQMYIRIEIPEKYASQVARGMKVKVMLLSQGNRKLEGTVTDIEFLFEDRRPKDDDVGLYSSHEPLGETIFHARVLLPKQAEGLPKKQAEGLPKQEESTLKPGTLAQVIFPFEN